jgi:hypothetical protein
MNTPLPTLPGTSAPDMNDSMLGMSLQAGNDTGAVMRGDMDLNEFGMRQLAAVASNPNAPAPIKAEANRMIGQALAAELAAQPLPWYQGGVDAARRGAQAVRGIDIPTPDLSGASMPDVDMPSFGLPSLGINLSGIDLPSLSIPTPPSSSPVSTQEVGQAVAPAKSIPASVAAAARKNVTDPLLANSQDTSIFGVDTSGLALPSFGFNVRDIPAPSLPSSAGIDLPGSLDSGFAIPKPDWSPSLPSVDVGSGVDRARSVVENAADAVGNIDIGGDSSLGSGTPSRIKPLPQPGAYGSTNPQTPEDWAGATTRSLQLMRSYDERNNTSNWYDKTGRYPIEIDGKWQKTVVAKDANGAPLRDANGNVQVVGYITPDDTIVPIGNDMLPEDAIADIVANAAEGSADWGDFTANPDAATETAANAAKTAASSGTGKTLEDVSVPTPDDTSTSSRSSGSRSSGGGSYDRSYDRDYDRSYSRSYDDGGGYEREFTADDFLDAADGDRKKAAMMARFANKRRRSRGRRGAEESGDSGMWPGFPFNRPPSPIRANILTSLGEAFAQAFPNRRA